MPPKKASGASKKETKKANAEFENRKEEILDEAEQREEAMREWITKKKADLLKGMLESIASLDPALLKMTVGELMSMPVPSGEDTDENQEMRTAREMTAENERARPNQIEQTAVRPQKALRVMELRTPAGNAFKCPSLITPRVGGGSMTTRAIRPDEVAFSAAGSPIVMGMGSGGGDGRGARGDSDGFDQFHQLVNADEEALSPNSRQLVKTIKEFIQRKAQVGDPV